MASARVSRRQAEMLRLAERGMGWVPLTLSPARSRRESYLWSAERWVLLVRRGASGEVRAWDPRQDISAAMELAGKLGGLMLCDYGSQWKASFGPDAEAYHRCPAAAIYVAALRRLGRQRS